MARSLIARLAGPACLAALAGPAAAQQRADSLTVVADSTFGASGLHQLLFGRNYRALWTAPVRVPVLDLAREAGGLVPLKRGGGQQTRSLRLRAADGRQFVFRTVSKDPSVLLPPELRRTFLAGLLQDQMSAGHPGGALVAAPLLAAAGVLHATPRLVVMPDDPALGAFRDAFAGAFGLLEERPTAGDGELEGFAGALDVADTYATLRRIEEHPDEDVDRVAYLDARLMDLLLGDWDRHADQWRWAAFDSGAGRAWRPIPRDRDQAFVRFGGLLLDLARLSAPQLVEFGPGYPSTVGLSWNPRYLDRWLLPPLDWPVWEARAAALQGRLTDAVIEGAVGALPEAWRARDGARLAADLRARRDRLPEAARRLYALLAREVDLRLTDADEQLTLTLDGDAVTVALAGPRGRPLRRTFTRRETDEVRLFLQGGDDRVTVTGTGRDGPLVRILGGGGDDAVADEARGSRLALYDEKGMLASTGRSHRIDRRPFPAGELSRENPQPPRDWGHFLRLGLESESRPEVGFFAGLRANLLAFGFRTVPYAARLGLGGGYATGAGRGLVTMRLELPVANARATAVLDARASGIEQVRFYGVGNETVRPGLEAAAVVRQTRALVRPQLEFHPRESLRVTVGGLVSYAESDGTPFSGPVPVRGAGRFGHVALTADLAWDTRDVRRAATRGFVLAVGGSVAPPLWDAEGTFGEVHAEARTYLTARRAPLRPTLALRTLGRAAWGPYPFFEAAYVGGARTVRGFREWRFAGDRSLVGNAELRLRLGSGLLVVPAEFGVFGFADAGRVWLRGEVSDTWHAGAGGGVWLGLFGGAGTVSAALGRGEDRTALYLRAGVGF